MPETTVTVTPTPATPVPLQTPPDTGKVDPTSTTTEKTGGKTYTEAEVETIIKDRLNREKAKLDKATEEAKAKAEQEALAKNAEWEKLAKAREGELSTIKAELARIALTEKKRVIAEKVGLPPALASRLNGETDEDIEKDAKALLETLPKPTKPAGIGPVPNPGNNGQQGLTDAQLRNMLRGNVGGAFDLDTNLKTGGGFSFPSE